MPIAPVLLVKVSRTGGTGRGPNVTVLVSSGTRARGMGTVGGWGTLRGSSGMAGVVGMTPRVGLGLVVGAATDVRMDVSCVRASKRLSDSGAKREPGDGLCKACTMS